MKPKTRNGKKTFLISFFKNQTADLHVFRGRLACSLAAWGWCRCWAGISCWGMVYIVCTSLKPYRSCTSYIRLHTVHPYLSPYYNYTAVFNFSILDPPGICLYPTPPSTQPSMHSTNQLCYGTCENRHLHVLKSGFLFQLRVFFYFAKRHNCTRECCYSRHVSQTPFAEQSPKPNAT